MAIKDNSTNNLKEFIRNYNLAKPNWDSLPKNFPDCNKRKLTNRELLLLDAIKLAWINENKNGKKYIINKSIQTVLILIAIGISLIEAGKLSFAKSGLIVGVNAATVSANLRRINLESSPQEIWSEIIESTNSALIGRTTRQ